MNARHVYHGAVGNDLIVYEFSRSQGERGDFDHFLGLYGPGKLPSGRLETMQVDGQARFAVTFDPMTVLNFLRQDFPRRTLDPKGRANGKTPCHNRPPNLPPHLPRPTWPRSR